MEGLLISFTIAMSCWAIVCAITTASRRIAYAIRGGKRYKSEQEYNDETV